MNLFDSVEQLLLGKAVDKGPGTVKVGAKITKENLDEIEQQ